MFKNKTKIELIAELKKLQRKLVLLETKSSKKNESKELVLSTSHWNSFFKNSANIIVVVDKKGNILDINRVVKGLKKETVLGQSAYSFVAKEHQGIIKKNVEAVFKTGKPKEYKLSGLGPDGSLSHYSSKLTPILENKKIVAVIIDTIDVTNEIATQEKLTQSEFKYKKLSEAAFESIVIHQNGNVVEVNQATIKLFGYSEKQLINQPIHKFIDPSFHKTAVLKFQNQDDSVFELLMIKKGGIAFWAEVVGRSIEYNNELAHVVAIRDISQQKEYEKNLKESEERFRMLADNAVDIISRYQVYPEHKLIYTSPSIERVTGYTQAEFYADPFLGQKIIHPDDLALLKDKNNAPTSKYEKKTPVPFVARWIKKDGGIIWIETINRPVFDEQNRLVGFESVARDITERKLLEQEKSIGERALTQVLNNINELVYYIQILPDGSKKVKYLGDQIERILGITKTEYEQEAGALLKFVHPDDVAKIIQKAGTLKNKKAPQQFVYRFQHQKTKEYLWLEERVTPQFDDQGKHVGNFGITTDVTDRILAEQAIKQSEERFRMMAENAMDVIYRYTIIPHARYEYISPSIFKMSGYTPEDFYADPYIAFKIIHPDDIHLIGDAENSLKKKNKINSIKDPSVILRWIKKDGSIIWTETKTQNVFNELGEKIAIEGITRDVTQQKQSVENYKSLVDFTPDGVMIHVDGFIKFANPSALKMIGAKTFDELENKSSFELILPEYHNQLVERIKRTKQGEELDFAEIKIKTFDNRVLTIETKPIAIKFNGIDAIQVVFHDVTAQKQLMREQLRAQIAEETNQNLQKQISERIKAESELKEAQKFTRLIIESSIDMICASDKDGYITEFNQAALDTFGYTLDEVIGKHGSILYAIPNDRIEITNNDLLKKGTFSGEVLNRKKNGEVFISYLSASVLKNENGEIIGSMGVSRDISKEKEAEQRLREQSAKLNAVFESSSHVIWTINREYKITSFNTNFAKHMQVRYGVKAEIGLDMVSGDTVSNEKYNKFWIEKYNAVFKGKADYFETQLIDKFGELVWREIYLNPILDNNGKVVEVSGIGHDITEKKLAEEKIKQSLDEKEVLLKEVHHRVKNNLQVISSILNLQSSYVKDQGTLNILKESQNRIKSMAFIHESLYQTKDFSSINFSEYVVNLANNLMHSYSNFENEIKLNLDIQNVFLNLDLAIPCGLIINEIVSNALKYAFVEKSQDGEISITMKSDGENLSLLIGDNGIGLPKEIDYRNTESLGLQLVVTLTDQLNGEITLDTTKGTKYTIIFNQNQAKNRI